MRIANNAEKVTGAMNTSTEHAIVSKVVADLYINRMQRLVPTDLSKVSKDNCRRDYCACGFQAKVVIILYNAV